MLHKTRLLNLANLQLTMHPASNFEVAHALLVPQRRNACMLITQEVRTDLNNGV